jgi:hypothetical protein
VTVLDWPPIFDPALADAWLLVVRAVEGGLFADLGLENLFPGGYAPEFSLRFQPIAASYRRVDVYDRAVSLTGADGRVVAEVLRRLWGWNPEARR